MRICARGSTRGQVGQLSLHAAWGNSAVARAASRAAPWTDATAASAALLPHTNYRGPGRDSLPRSPPAATGWRDSESPTHSSPYSPKHDFVSFFCRQAAAKCQIFRRKLTEWGFIATLINTPALVAVRLPTWITLKMAGSWKNARYGPDKRWASKSARSSTTRSQNFKMFWSSRGEFTLVELRVVASAASR